MSPSKPLLLIAAILAAYPAAAQTTTADPSKAEPVKAAPVKAEPVKAADADAPLAIQSIVVTSRRVAERLQDNLGNPFARMFYGISCLHCVPQSLAQGGLGLGACWGE